MGMKIGKINIKLVKDHWLSRIETGNIIIGPVWKSEKQQLVP